ncbi:hypothetical protein [Trichothermofontia sp.]
MVHRLSPPTYDLDTTYDGELERYNSPALMPASLPSAFSATLMGQIGRQILDSRDWLSHGGSHHCPVLVAPLGDRDMRAMTLIFETEAIGDFEMEIEQMLLFLVPEPCWEEDLVRGAHC